MSIFATVAQQIVEEECPSVSATSLSLWVALQTHFFEAHSIFYGVESSGVESRTMGFGALLQGLDALLNNLQAAYDCPLSTAKHFRLAAEWAQAMGQPHRARGLVQLGNVFKLQAMARWWSTLPPGVNGLRFEPRFQVEYTIAVTQLHAALKVPLRPLVADGDGAPTVEIHSICTYSWDVTSKTGPECPLPELSVPNHRAYAARHGHRYVLHTRLPLPGREAHFSKVVVVHEALRGANAPDWVFFIDCDAFFTNPEIKIGDVLRTYGALAADGPHFLVAEDPGGINTGTLIVKRSDWSGAFLERVATSQLGIAWDQSMFLEKLLWPGLLEHLEKDFQYPREVALVHQAHLNAFVPPAARDWNAYQWQPGDFVRHFAGCPWQEEHCLRLMRETAALWQPLP